MNNKELYFEKDIVQIMPNTSIKRECVMTVVCRFIKYKDGSIFAEEVSTNTIFPVIFRKENEDDYKKACSNICMGDYYIEVVTKNNDDLNLNDPLSIDELLGYMRGMYNNKQSKKVIIAFGKQNRFYVSPTKIKIEGNVIEKKEIKKEKKIDIKEISKFGFDLSEINNDTILIGREKEIKEIIKITAIKKKSVLLVGDSGTGKTVIVEDIAKNHMNRFLEGKLIFSLNTLSLIAGTKYRGTFEENIQKVIDFCSNNNGNIILFIDEIHALNGLGASDENKGFDALNILKPYINNGSIIVIGATTKDEYNRHISDDPAFSRRLEKIDINPLTHDELIMVLYSYIQLLESKYQIKLDLNDNEKIFLFNELLRITDINRQNIINNTKVTNPTISKNILENAFVEAVYNNSYKVTMNDIIYAINECVSIYKSLKEEAENNLSSLKNNDKEEKGKVLKLKDYSLV